VYVRACNVCSVLIETLFRFNHMYFCGVVGKTHIHNHTRHAFVNSYIHTFIHFMHYCVDLRAVGDECESSSRSPTASKASSSVSSGRGVSTLLTVSIAPI
jgi:hypothetical protein